MTILALTAIIEQSGPEIFTARCVEHRYLAVKSSADEALRGLQLQIAFALLWEEAKGEKSLEGAWPEVEKPEGDKVPFEVNPEDWRKDFERVMRGVVVDVAREPEAM